MSGPPPRVLLGVGCAAAALVVPALEGALARTAIGDFAPSVSLIPLLVALALLWAHLRPADRTPSRHSLGVCVAVGLAGPVLAYVLGRTAGVTPTGSASGSACWPAPSCCAWGGSGSPSRCTRPSTSTPTSP